MNIRHAVKKILPSKKVKYKSRQELYDELHKEYLTEENIAKKAYELWQEDGCPDGEEMHPHFDIKIKDLHWWEAELQLDLLAEIDAEVLWSLQDRL